MSIIEAFGLLLTLIGGAMGLAIVGGLAVILLAWAAYRRDGGRKDLWQYIKEI